MMSLFFVNTSHAGQKHLIVFIFGETDDFPRAQKSAFGGDSESLLPLHVGQAPQYFLQISRFSTVSSTVFVVVSGDFMVLFTQEVLVRRENNTFTPKLKLLKGGRSSRGTAIDIQEGVLSQAQERARNAYLTTIRFLRAVLLVKADLSAVTSTMLS